MAVNTVRESRVFKMIVNVYIEDDRSLKENLLLTNNPKSKF